MVERANEWYQKRGWIMGCNFSPSTAINQLEMWQPETFDPATIDRELGWAEDLGFNTVRVFLHNLLWTQDQKGFLKRMDQFLALADKHHIGVMFVPLDAVWDPFPKLGKQHEPVPHVHNSGWVQSPGVEILRDPARHDELKGYVQGVMRHFKSDKRIVAWDVSNEPDNMNRPAYEKSEPANKPDMALLLKKVFAWAREVDPKQPLTAGVWERGRWGANDKLLPIEEVMLEQSDIISFTTTAALRGEGCSEACCIISILQSLLNAVAATNRFDCLEPRGLQAVGARWGCWQAQTTNCLSQDSRT